MFGNEELQCEDKCKLPNLKLDWVQQFQEKSQTAHKDCQRFNAWRSVLFLDGSLLNLPRFCELLCARALREIHGKLYNVVDLITTPWFLQPFHSKFGDSLWFCFSKVPIWPFHLITRRCLRISLGLGLISKYGRRSAWNEDDHTACEVTGCI